MESLPTETSNAFCAPWTAKPRGDGWHIVDANGARVATAHAMKPAEPKLIAAAPELLDLARQYASECGECSGTGVTPDGNGGDEPCTDPYCQQIRAVIAKAEGRA